MLSTKSIKIIKSTVPLLEKYGVEITSTFYKDLFAANPQLLNIFNHSNQRNSKQPVALANTILQAAIHIDKLNEINLMPIVHKHVALHILPEHYPIVGGHLIGAMKKILADEATPEIINAWTEAYRSVAQAFMDAEEDLYYETEEQEGGWSDVRSFTIDRKVEETHLVTSFYLKPTDGEAIATFIPGQYLTVKIDLPGDGVDVPLDSTRTYVRHYSLSDQPNDEYYRLSIKKELGNGASTPCGIVSNYFHNTAAVGDKIMCSVPSGDFVVDSASDTPVLLICGGVGLNPLLSMAKESLLMNSTRIVNLIHSTNNENTLTFRDELDQLKDEYQDGGNFNLSLLYTDTQGHLTCDIISKSALNITQELIQETDVYICGPPQFMISTNKSLLSLGYHKENIHYELFGPLTPVLDENQMLKSHKSVDIYSRSQ